MPIKAQIEELTRENRKLKRKIERYKFDIKHISKMFVNAELMKTHNEKEKNLQTFYNNLFLANCPDIIILLDNDFNLVLCTKSISLLLGEIEPENLKRKNFATIFAPLCHDWAADTLKNCRNVFNTCKQMSYDEEIPAVQDGTVTSIYANTIIKCVFNSNGILSGIALLIHDNTDIYNSLLKAEKSSRIRSQFLAQISHEIRTPMNAIKGMSDLLLLSDLSGIQKEYSKNISMAAGSLLLIINDVLDYSKIEAGKLEVYAHEYDFQSFILDICNTAYYEAREKNLEFFTDIDPEIPSILAGDDIRLKQILTNLLNNAVKYTNEGYVKLVVKCYFTDQSQVKLEFEVKDTGKGVKQSNISDLFEPFQQMEKYEFHAKGSGLGLAICSNLLKLMNSSLQLESSYGKGSRFYFSVNQNIIKKTPLADVDNKFINILAIVKKVRLKNLTAMLTTLGLKHIAVESTAKALVHNSEAITHLVYESCFHQEIINAMQVGLFGNCKNIILKDTADIVSWRYNNTVVVQKPVLIFTLARAFSNSGTEQHRFSSGAIGSFLTKGVRVLLVDDNNVNLIVGEAILNHYGIEVHKAGNGLIAYNMFKDNLYDMIFMDHVMPVMDGPTAARKIRSLEGWGTRVPIIALTANDSDSVEKISATHMNAILAKPIDVNELNKVLIKWLPDAKISDVSAQMLEKFKLIGLDVSKSVHNYPSKTEYIEFLKHIAEKYPSKSARLSLLKGKVLIDELIKIKQNLTLIGARELANRTVTIMHTLEEGNTELFKEYWNTYLDNLLLLTEKIKSIIDMRS